MVYKKILNALLRYAEQVRVEYKYVSALYVHAYLNCTCYFCLIDPMCTWHAVAQGSSTPTRVCTEGRNYRVKSYTEIQGNFYVQA